MLLKTTSSLILALFLLGSGIVATNNGSVEAQTVSQNSRRANRQEILEKLNLTPQQKQKIASIRQKHRSEIEGLRQQIRTNQEELQTMMAGNSTDKELMAKHQKITELPDWANLCLALWEEQFMSPQVIAELAMQDNGPLTNEQKLIQIKIDRNSRLSATDWTQLPDVISIHDQLWINAWKEYRQALRDLPKNITNYDDVFFPMPPSQ
jgi:uncharacterized protein (UPF0248 family)